MGAREYVRFVRRYARLLAIALLSGCAVALALYLAHVPTFTASTQIVLSANTATSSQDLIQGDNYTQSLVKELAVAVETQTVLEPVARSLGASQSWVDLVKEVSPSTPTGTSVLTLNVTDRDADRAAQIANLVVAQLTTELPSITPNESKSLKPVKVNQLTVAGAPTEADPPTITSYAAAGLLGGLLVGGVVATLIELFDARLRSEKDVRSIAGKRAFLGLASADESLALLPRRVRTRRGAKRRRAISAASDGYDGVRGALARPQLNTGETLLVSSSQPSEGRCTFALQLSATYERANKRVMLIDADLFGAALTHATATHEMAGLADVLERRSNTSDATQVIPESQIAFLPLGQVTRDTGSLITSTKFTQLLRDLEQEYDVIVVLLPPALVSPLPVGIKPGVGRMIIVCKLGRTTMTDLDTTLHQFEPSSTTELSIVALTGGAQGSQSRWRRRVRRRSAKYFNRDI